MFKQLTCRAKCRASLDHKAPFLFFFKFYKISVIFSDVCGQHLPSEYDIDHCSLARLVDSSCLLGVLRTTHGLSSGTLRPAVALPCICEVLLSTGELYSNPPHSRRMKTKGGMNSVSEELILQSPRAAIDEGRLLCDSLPHLLLEPSAASRLGPSMDDERWSFVLSSTNPMLAVGQGSCVDVSGPLPFSFAEKTLHQHDEIFPNKEDQSLLDLAARPIVQGSTFNDESSGEENSLEEQIPVLWPSLTQDAATTEEQRIPASSVKNDASGESIEGNDSDLPDSLLDEILGNEYSLSVASLGETVQQQTKEVVPLTKEERALRRRAFHKVHTRRSRAKLNDKMDHLRRVLPAPPPGTCVKSKAQILDWAIACASAHRLPAPRKGTGSNTNKISPGLPRHTLAEPSTPMQSGLAKINSN